jgi:hypothetical protein
VWRPPLPLCFMRGRVLLTAPACPLRPVQQVRPVHQQPLGAPAGPQGAPLPSSSLASAQAEPALCAQYRESTCPATLEKMCDTIEAAEEVPPPLLPIRPRVALMGAVASQDVDVAVKAARTAYGTWSKLSGHERVRDISFSLLR